MPGLVGKRLTPALCALCLLCLLSGCAAAPLGGSGAVEEVLALPAPPPGEAAAPKDLVFAISRDAGAPLREAAAEFCAEYTRLTGRAAEVRDAIAPDNDLLTGRAQVALLNKRRQFEFNYLLSATATPFLYTGYQNFTMRANAKAALDMLASSLGSQDRLIPLGAFYQGTLHILSETPVTGYQQLEIEYFAISDGAEIKEIIERILGIPVVADTDAERILLFEEGEVESAEVSLGYLAEAGAPARACGLTLSYHNLIPVWLIATDSFYDSLEEETRAALTEAVAVMASKIDGAYRAEELAALQGLRLSGQIPIGGEMATVRNRVFNVMPALPEDAGAQRKLARDLVATMRGIG